MAGVVEVEVVIVVVLDVVAVAGVVVKTKCCFFLTGT